MSSGPCSSVSVQFCGQCCITQGRVRIHTDENLVLWFQYCGQTTKGHNLRSKITTLTRNERESLLQHCVTVADGGFGEEGSLGVNLRKTLPPFIPRTARERVSPEGHLRELSVCLRPFTCVCVACRNGQPGSVKRTQPSFSVSLWGLCMQIC